MSPTDAQGLARRRLGESVAVKRALLDDVYVDALVSLADRVATCLREGGKIVWFGNGGSAADATHLAAEFVGRFCLDRAPLPAMSLSDNGSAVTAIGNDYDYADVFARPLRAFGRPGDVAVGLSTSGTSPNVLTALAVARECGMYTAAFTGERGRGLAAAVDTCVVVPSSETARIQEGYMVCAHVLCELVEHSLFGAQAA